MCVLWILGLTKWKTHSEPFPFLPCVSLPVPCSCCGGTTPPKMIFKRKSLPEVFRGNQGKAANDGGIFCLHCKKSSSRTQRPVALQAPARFSVERWASVDVCHLSPTSGLYVSGVKPHIAQLYNLPPFSSYPCSMDSYRKIPISQFLFFNGFQ